MSSSDSSRGDVDGVLRLSEVTLPDSGGPVLGIATNVFLPLFAPRYPFPELGWAGEANILLSLAVTRDEPFRSPLPLPVLTSDIMSSLEEPELASMSIFCNCEVPELDSESFPGLVIRRVFPAMCAEEAILKALDEWWPAVFGWRE